MEEIKEDLREKIVEKLGKYPITNVDEAIRFLEEKDGAEEIKEVDWKWEVQFEDGEPYKFYSDENLIEWCKEQRDTYYGDDDKEEDAKWKVI